VKYEKNDDDDNDSDDRNKRVVPKRAGNRIRMSGVCNQDCDLHDPLVLISDTYIYTLYEFLVLTSDTWSAGLTTLPP
jgi:hypothetical protein